MGDKERQRVRVTDRQGRREGKKNRQVYTDRQTTAGRDRQTYSIYGQRKYINEDRRKSRKEREERKVLKSGVSAGVREWGGWGGGGGVAWP